MKIKSKKPVIGITFCIDKEGLIREGIDYNYIRREYTEQLRDAGASPIMLDNTIDPTVAAELCDGIVISGGENIDPMFYGQSMRYKAVTEPQERTAWELELIAACDARGKHILGICYGAQLLNVHYGGTLYQDIATELKHPIDHGTTTAATMKRVAFQRDFLGFQATDSVQTACRHHQAVKRLAPGFEVAAQAKDGIVEAIIGHGHYGVQWHAEADGTAPTIYSSFVSLVAQQNKARKLNPLRWLQPQPQLELS